MVIGHPRKIQLNSFIQGQKLAVDVIIFRLAESGSLVGLSASQIKDRVMAELYPPETEPAPKVSPYCCFIEFIKSKTGRTRQIYQTTLNRLLAFRPDFAELAFEDITYRWLEDFDRFMANDAPSRNARNIHHRNLRAVINRAIDDGLTICYPYRKYKIRAEATRKRDMSVAELRKIAFTTLPGWMEQYRDMWLLSFMLIGINVADLCALREVDGAGRIQYIRAKTHRLYSIRVEPEALALIDRYRGKDQLLYMMDSHTNYRAWYQQLCRGLTAIREYLNKIDDGVHIKELTSYNARHSWSTIAADLEIPDETISLALGHSGGNATTNIYIHRNRKKVDAANRRVIDWVLYGKQ